MNEIGTKERIRLAAAKVFTEKGYEAATTRDIAKEAGIKNMASLHYYYRSKEKLFELIIQEKMHDFSKVMDRCFGKQAPLHQKIREFVPAYIDFFRDHPYLPLFVMSEGQRNANKVNELIGGDQHHDILQEQLNHLIEQKIIRPISLGNFYCNIIGLVIFPFISKNVLQIKTGMNEAEYQELLEERKDMIAEMIIKYLYLEDPFRERV